MQESVCPVDTDRMKRLACLVLVSAALDGAEHKATGSPRIFIPAQEGFESYLSAAIVKKHVPAVVTQNETEARFVLTSSVISKEESTVRSASPGRGRK
jgi:hypothetical protein